MAKITVNLDQDDMKAALAYWVDQGMPKPDRNVSQRVTMGFSKASGNDPREYDYHYATVQQGEGE